MAVLGRAVLAAALIGGLGGLAGWLLLQFGATEAGAFALLTAPVLGLSSMIVALLASRPRRRGSASSGSAAASAVDGGFARVGVYRFKSGATETVLRRAEAELLPYLRRQPGFVGYQMIRTGPEEAVSLSIWQTRQQAEAAVETTVRWLKATVPTAVASVEHHVGRIAFSS